MCPIFEKWYGNATWARISRTNLLYCFTKKGPGYASRWYIHHDKNKFFNVDQPEFNLQIYIGDNNLIFQGNGNGWWVKELPLEEILVKIPCPKIKAELIEFFSSDSIL